MKKNKPVFLLLILLAVISIAILAWWFSAGSGQPKEPEQQGKPPATMASVLSQIEGYVVKTEQLEQSLPVSGTLIPWEETVLMPEVPGRIVTLNLPEGQTVKQGTVLVKLLDADLQAQVKKLEIQLETAKATEARQKSLLGVKGITQQEYDLTVLQINSLNADIDIIKTQIAKTEIKAPFDGKIGLKNVSPGAFVSPGQALATIRSLDNLKLDFSVPEQYAKDMKLGRKVTFNVEGSSQTYSATIVASEEEIDEGTRNLNFRARVDSRDGSLHAGAFASVQLPLTGKSSAMFVPSQCIIPQARFKKIVVSKNGKAEMVTVQTGLRRASDVEIMDGLHPGDTVVVTGVLFVKPGMNLKFAQVK